MKLFDKRLSTGWSFVFGMLFGALLVFARIGTSSVTRVSGQAPPSGTMDLSIRDAPFTAELVGNEAKEQRSPAVSVGAGSHPKRTPKREIRHPECDLQLD